MPASMVVAVLLLGQTSGPATKASPPSKPAAAAMKKSAISSAEAAARKTEFQANIRKDIEKRRAVAKSKSDARRKLAERVEFEDRMTQLRAQAMTPIIGAQQYRDSQASLEQMRALVQADANRANAQAYAELVRLQQMRLAVWQEMSPDERVRVEKAEQARVENERKAIQGIIHGVTGQGRHPGGVAPAPGQTAPPHAEHHNTDAESHKPEHVKKK
jgi:hypothetical protein